MLTVYYLCILWCTSVNTPSLSYSGQIPCPPYQSVTTRVYCTAATTTSAVTVIVTLKVLDDFLLGKTYMGNLDPILEDLLHYIFILFQVVKYTLIL
jgi:hypothetical protein